MSRNEQPRRWRSDGTTATRWRGRSEVNTYVGAPQWSVQLAATDSALGCAQREVWRVMDGWGLHHVADVVELLALELVSVALSAGGQELARPRYRELLRVRWLSLRFRLGSEGLVIATWDSDPRPPRFKQPGAGHGDGSELYWVPMLAEAWDYFQSGSGKVVWAEIRIPMPGERWLPQRAAIVRPALPPMPANLDPSLLARVVRGLRRLNVATP